MPCSALRGPVFWRSASRAAARVRASRIELNDRAEHWACLIQRADAGEVFGDQTLGCLDSTKEHDNHCIYHLKTDKDEAKALEILSDFIRKLVFLKQCWRNRKKPEEIEAELFELLSQLEAFLNEFTYLRRDTPILPANRSARWPASIRRSS